MKLVYGLDLGSSSIKICKKDSVIELKESSVIEKITNDDGTFSYGLAGNDVDKYYQKNQKSELIYPIKSGIVVDKDALIELLTRFFNKLIPKKSIFQKLEFYILAECGLSVDQYNEIREICYKIGACKVTFLPPAICAIYGYDLELSQFENFCLADLGADTAKFYLCSKNSVIKGLSINCAGNAIDEFLGIHALKMEKLILDKKEKESLKLNVASIMETNNATYTANGINAETLVKDSHTFSSNDFKKIMQFCFSKYVYFINDYLRLNYQNGKIVLIYGGSSKFNKLDAYFFDNLDPSSIIVSDKDDIALLGLLKLMKKENVLDEIINNCKNNINL